MFKLCAGVCFASVCLAQAPSPDLLKQVLEKRLLALKPDGFTERQVLFQDVRPMAKNGAFYPFRVTALIRDYGPGYPANRFFGETCVGRLDRWVFNLGRNGAGDWQVDGRMTVTDGRKCEANPGPGVSSIPLRSLAGTPAPKGPVAGAGKGAAELHMGEWACYGVGGRLLAGLGFTLQPDGTYLDADKKAAGRWNRSADGIVFRGGPLDGQTGKNFQGNRFELSGTVSCEPWK